MSMENNLKAELESEIRRLNQVENEMIENLPIGQSEENVMTTPEWRLLDHQRNYCKSLVLTIDLLDRQFEIYKETMQRY